MMNRLAFSIILGLLCGSSTRAQQTKSAAERLTAQGKQFDEQVVKIAENVYTAVGFSVSNVSMIVADHLLALDPEDTDAKQIKANALTGLARNMVNATARNYYLTVARELRESPE